MLSKFIRIHIFDLVLLPVNLLSDSENIPEMPLQKEAVGFGKTKIFVFSPLMLWTAPALTPQSYSRRKIGKKEGR